jgi:hypothetical protein
MKPRIGWIALGVAVLAAVAYLIFAPGVRDEAEPVDIAVPEQAAPEPMPPAAPEQPRYEVSAPEPAEEEQIVLPALADSDALATDAVTELAGKDWVEEKLVTKGIIRRIVVTVDNLPRAKAAVELWPLRPVGGPFLVNGGEERPVISADNYPRYDALVQIVAAVDTARLAEQYFRMYPLFQEAFVELGYPDGYFNDRLIEVIDDLLAAPEIEDPVRLVRPHVLYKYADPALEASSAGHKILIRMGRKNAAIVKEKLRAFRQELVAGSAGN